MQQSASLSFERPLFVHIAGGAYHHVFELDAAEERAFLVGSSRSADLCIDRVGVAAVEFHVERVDGEIWLVPGYRGGGVLVNGVPLVARRRVYQRLIVDLGAVSLELYASEDELAPGAARSSSAPRPLPSDYGASLPTDTARTAIAMTPVIGGFGDAPPDAEDDPLLKTQPLAVVRPPVLTEERTERMAPIVAPPVPLQETQRLAPVRPVPTLVVLPVEQLPAAAPAPAPALDGFEALAAQETTAFDVEACVPPESPPRTVAPSLPPRPARAAKRPLRRSGGPLEQLGLLAKARPGLVLGGGLAAALLASLALVGAMQLTAKRSEQVVTPGAASRSATTTVASSAAVADVAPPIASSSPVVVPPPPAASAPPRASRTNDPELVAAVGHLAAGRLVEAAGTYHQLSARPEGAEVYGRLAAVLARISASSCAAKTSPSTVSCPELLK